MEPLYILRFQIVPGKHAQERALDLAEFCRRHNITEVALFFACEEWNNGLLSQQEEDRWFETVKMAREILHRKGIGASLDPGITVLSAGRGRKFPADRHFEPMVSPLGEVSQAHASLACPKWREYICAQFRRFATLDFRIIWIEDDFRYRNHRPLTWGGGFEPPVLKRFSEKVGHEVVREEVVQRILASGKPDPWRGLWQETWREIQLEVAGLLASAVEQGSHGRTKLGLMSSCPQQHSLEGRDWFKLFETLSIDGQVAHRPNFTSYGEVLGRNLSRAIQTLDLQRQLRPEGIECAPEIENFTYSRWQKPDCQTWAEAALVMVYGSDALFFDLFPFTGNSVKVQPLTGDLLDNCRAAAEWIAQHIPRGCETLGVGIPWKTNASALVHAEKAESIDDLMVNPFGAGNMLIHYGVPVSAQKQSVNALFGNTAWIFDDDEIRKLLSGGLLLDGESAAILIQRGFAEDIGVQGGQALDRESSAYSLERFASSECGVAEGYHDSVNLLSRIYVMEPLSGCKELSSIINPQQERIGAGLTTFCNHRGGRIGTFSYDIASPSLAKNYQRQAVLHALYSFLADDSCRRVVLSGGAYLLPIHLQKGRNNYVVMMNGAPDPAMPVAHFGNSDIEHLRATMLPPLGRPVEVNTIKTVSEDGVKVQIDQPLPYFGYAVLEFCYAI